ncbi:MAG: hypothetical protein Kow0059_11540 [Candidatus Sumerlaeia bacterium]
MAIVLLVYAALRLWGAADRSLWLDEIKTLQSARLPLGYIIPERAGNGHLPFYFLFMHFYIPVFGESHLALRLPSLIGSVLTLLAVWAMARRIFPSGDGWWLAPLVFLALNSFDVRNAQLVRPYAMLTATAGWSAWVMLVMLTDAERTARRHWWAALYAVLNLIGLGLHPTYALLILAQMLLLLIVRGRAADPRAWSALAAVQVGLVLAAGAALAALAAWQQGVEDSDLQPPDVDRTIRRAGMVLFGLFDWTGKKSLFKYITLAVLVGIPALELRVWRRVGRTPGRLAGVVVILWFYGCLAMLLAASLSTGKIVAADRYFSIMLPVSPLLLALPLRRMNSAKWRTVWAGVCSVLLVVTLIAALRAPGDGLMEAISYVRDHLQPGDAVFVCSCTSNPAAFRYYTGGEIDPGCADSCSATPEQAAEFIAAQTAPRLWFFLYHCDGKGLSRYLERHAAEVTGEDWLKVRLFLYTAEPAASP